MPDRAYRPTVAVTRQAVSLLEEALRDLRAFNDPTDDSCGVSEDARVKAAPYLSSWVENPIILALRKLDLEFFKRDPNEQEEN